MSWFSRSFQLAVITCLMIGSGIATAAAMPINVTSQGWPVLQLDVEPSEIVDQVKQLIADARGIPAGNLILTYQGQVLEPGRTLQDYNVQPGSSLQLTGNRVLLVTSLQDGVAGSLRQVLQQALAGETIRFQARGEMVLGADLLVDRDITIDGPAEMLGAYTWGRSWRIEPGVTATIRGIGIVRASSLGGIWNRGHLTLENVLLYENRSVAPPGAGGITNEGTLHVSGTTIEASLALGPSAVANFGQAVFTNSTIGGGSSSSGVAIHNAGSLKLIHSTVSDGTPAVVFGAPPSPNGSSLTFVNTIIDATGPNCAAHDIVVAHGATIGTDATCPGVLPAASAQIALGALAENGGPTPTRALLAGSVARDVVAAGECHDFSDEARAIDTDQRGEPRPKGPACDAGAFEAEAAEPPADTVAPVVTYTGNAGSYTVDQTIAIACAATDEGSGVVATTCADIKGPAYTFGVGAHSFSATATDAAGNVGHGSVTFTVTVTPASLQGLVTRLVTNAGVASGLNAKLAAAARAPNARARAGQLGAFANQLRGQIDRTVSAADAAVLMTLTDALY